MDTEKLIFLGLLILLGIVLGVFIGYTLRKVSTHVEVRTETITLPSQSSVGTSIVYRNIHDTTWIKVRDTVRITNPECLPYETMRSDSLVEVFIKSYPLYKFNWDSVVVKERHFVHQDTTTINTLQTGLSYWYLPVVVIEALIIILKK